MTATAATLDVRKTPEGTVLAFAGRLDSGAVARLWTRARREAARKDALVLDLTGVTVCDMAGSAFIVALEQAYGGEARLDGASDAIIALVRRARLASQRRVTPPPRSPTTRQWLWSGLQPVVRSATNGIAFLGETLVGVIRLPARRRMLRFSDLLRYADQAGVHALPLILLLGYLMGLILAFQSAVPMRQFGADIYVANLVSVSLLRELGPLLSAVILAGRTGSAFAAEIGTMKVNEEVDALVTMGLDPMTMLVMPRLIAAMLVMPALTLALDVAGLAGMATVMTGFGFPPVTVLHQIQLAAKPSDLFGGLFKAICFGAAVAAIGCRSGLATGVGPRAVGLAATSAVVGGIVATILLDGAFALIFYRIGL